MSNSSDQPREDGSHLARLLGLAYLMLCLAATAWQIWELLPDHRKTAVKLRLLKSSTQATNALARRTGAASIRHEAMTGEQVYGLPLWLSLRSLHLEQAYQRERGGLA